MAKKWSELLGVERDMEARQDNTRMKDIGPTETLDLTEEQKKDLEATSSWEKGKRKMNNADGLPIVDHERKTKDGREIATSDITTEYTNPKTGEIRKVKEGEVQVLDPVKKLKKNDWGTGLGRMLFKSIDIEQDEKDKVKTTPRK